MPIYELDGQAPDLPPEGTYFIADNAVLIGKVRLKPGASVWYGSVLRGDNEWIEIGAETNIQESCTLHTDMGYPLTVGDRCTIGHNVILHGCTVAEHSLIGMGAIVLNGAKVAKNSIVGAGALVTENKEFAENALIVGSPAKAVRELDERMLTIIRFGYKFYVEKSERYRKGLKRIG